MQPQRFITNRLVKSEDLNHHGTLFAGRGCEWIVESGFIAAASLLNPKSIVCVKVHGIHFTLPVKPGEVICFESMVINTGRSSLTSYVSVTHSGYSKTIVDGFITFVHVDENTRSKPHGIVIEAVTDEEKRIQEIAKNLPK
ncbi:MAG: acyl-CoA thioesterase [Prevotellaceae bacterium]|jgi:acyl-CoA hydrolase|nr:acyl-CoA thioesterase [Prevotellaceae bacterium]